MDLLTHYNYIISYRLGDRNGAANALSRRAELTPENPKEEQPTTLFPLDKFRDLATKVAQLNDQEYIEVVIAILKQATLSNQAIQDNIWSLPSLTQLPETVVLQQGLPYQDDHIFIPTNELKCNILQLYYNSPIAGHLGCCNRTPLNWSEEPIGG